MTRSMDSGRRRALPTRPVRPLSLRWLSLRLLSLRSRAGAVVL